MQTQSNVNIDPEIYMRACLLAKKLHWFQINPEDGVIELFLDHHMMSTFRMCPARFHLEMVEGFSPKNGFWFLEFGTLLHSCIEFYYNNFRDPEFTVPKWYDYASNLWAQGNFESYKDLPNYKALGGRIGFLGLLQQYWFRFAPENERLRVIGTELYFGKGREVPLLAQPLNERIPFRLFLAGKIDILVDTGLNIAPMDHKSHGDFRGKNPNLSYEIQDGMTGYVYANVKLVERMGLELGSRKTNMIIMNHIQVKPPGDKQTYQDRFTRIPLRKTEWDLEQYRLRQISTARDIFNMLIDSFDGIVPQFNTGVCSNWWHRDCQFSKVHRQVGAEAQHFVLLNEYFKKPIWDPENRDQNNLISSE